MHKETEQPKEIVHRECELYFYHQHHLEPQAKAQESNVVVTKKEEEQK